MPAFDYQPGSGHGHRRDRPSGLSGPKPLALGLERRSSPRLQAFDYRGSYAYHVVINTARGHEAFISALIVSEALDVLRDVSLIHGFAVQAYCFMPDHLHLLVTGSEESALPAFMKLFKQRTAYRYKARTGRTLWHRSYYDRVLRQEDDLGRVVGYIWSNPLTAGLADDASEYPFSGPREAMGPDRPEGLSLRSPLPRGAPRG